MERYQRVFDEEKENILKEEKHPITQVVNYYNKWNHSRLPMLPKSIKVRDKFNSAVTSFYREYLETNFRGDEGWNNIVKFKSKAQNIIDQIHRYKKSL